MRRGALCRLTPLLVVMIVAILVCLAEAQTADITHTWPTQADRETPRHDERQDIEPPDVYAHMLLVQDELELIRLEMGKPKDMRREIGVSNAALHEVFFQAITLFHKANRLSFDLTRERAELPEQPVGSLRPAHVWEVVNATLARLRRVKALFESRDQARNRPPEPTKTLSDIFRSIVQANRQMNLLLDQPFAPSDVFQQVTFAVGYAAQLRTRFPSTRMPDPPPFEWRKRPADVYHRLVECFARVRAIMQRSGLHVLTLDHHPEMITSSDVYDIASLIVSELSFLHAHLNSALAPPAPYNPGRKFPSDVYQRAGLLEALLIDLQALVEASPSWLQVKEERE